MKFKYKVFNKDGQVIESVMDSSSKDDLIAKLQGEGNIIVSVDEAPLEFSSTFLEKLTERITEKDVVMASKQLSTLIGGGIQALRSFRLMASESSSKALGKRFTIIADDVQSGIPIYKALARHPDVFNNFYISMVHAGEESGKLREVLEYLANYLERNYELIQKTKKALTYPVFVIFTFIVVMLVMSIFVLPKLAELLTQQGQTLPTYTQFIVDFSHFILSYWWMIVPAIVLLGYYFVTYIKTPNGAAYFDNFKLRIPAINQLYKKLYLSRMADNIETMLASGVPIVQALQITSEVVDNYVFRKMIERVESKVRQGKLLSVAFSEEPLIPTVMVQMTRIGEETGELGYMLKNLSQFYKRELEQTIESTLALLEPVMIVVMGLGVGVLVSSVLMPMYNLTTSIQ
jgi:type IV pilus assembly protein PilC